MKLCGILFLFISISSLGFFISEKYISKLKDIQRVDLFIKNVLLGLENENMTINEIFEFIEKSCDDKTKNFLYSSSPENFKKISEIAYTSDFCKDKTVILILDEVFYVLGKYSAAEQIKEINFCRNKVISYSQKKENSFLEKAKLSRCSGVLAGILAAIMFI